MRAYSNLSSNRRRKISLILTSAAVGAFMLAGCATTPSAGTTAVESVATTAETPARGPFVSAANPLAAAVPFYGAPQHLVQKTPTADLEELRPGKPDEEAHGVTYAEIDAFLHGEKVSDEAYATIVRTYDNTRHKRELPLVP